MVVTFVVIALYAFRMNRVYEVRILRTGGRCHNVSVHLLFAWKECPLSCPASRYGHWLIGFRRLHSARSSETRIPRSTSPESLKRISNLKQFRLNTTKFKQLPSVLDVL